MKQLIYFYLFTLLPLSQAFSQTYIPFDLTDTKWVMSYLYPSQGGVATESFFEVYTKGDTLIDDKIYTIVATKNLCRLSYTPTETTSHDNFAKEEYVFGALREEDKRVYYYRFDAFKAGYNVPNLESEIDHLIYDFNVEVGDTIYHSSEVYTIIFDSYASSGVKVYEYINTEDESFANPSDALIREGRGSDDGLFAAFYGYYSNLECYASGAPLDGIACTNCSNYITSTENIYPTDRNVLYPNPAYSQLFIHDEYTNELERVVVYNIQGQRVKTLELIKGVNSIDLIGITPGVLIFELEFNTGQRKLEKIVVCD